MLSQVGQGFLIQNKRDLKIGYSIFTPKHSYSAYHLFQTKYFIISAMHYDWTMLFSSYFEENVYVSLSVCSSIYHRCLYVQYVWLSLSVLGSIYHRCLYVQYVWLSLSVLGSIYHRYLYVQFSRHQKSAHRNKKTIVKTTPRAHQV